MYYNNEHPYNSYDGIDQTHYWNSLTITQNTNVLKPLAIKIFKLAIHSRGAESLFSIMGYIKNKVKKTFKKNFVFGF